MNADTSSLARLAGLMRDRDLAGHAVLEAGRLELQAEIGRLRRRMTTGHRPSGAGPFTDACLDGAEERFLIWAVQRLRELNTRLAAQTALCEESRTRAARSLGRARVLDELTGLASRGGLRRPGARYR